MPEIVGGVFCLRFLRSSRAASLSAFLCSRSSLVSATEVVGVAIAMRIDTKNPVRIRFDCSMMIILDDPDSEDQHRSTVCCARRSHHMVIREAAGNSGKP